MDQWLANIYGTGGGEDLEKTAQAVMLQKLAEEEGVDLSGLDEAQLEALADEVLGGEGDVVEDGGIDQQEQVDGGYEVTEEQLAKEAQAKFEEADFLGRVMAHSYTQELEKIASRREARERQAAGTARPYEQKGGLGAKSSASDRSAAGAHRSAGDKLRAGPASGLNTRINARKMAPKETTMSMRYHSAKNKLKSGLGSAKAGIRSAGRFVGKHKVPFAVGAGAAAAGAAAGRMSKEASAFEKLALEHAQQILGTAEQSLAQQQAIQQQLAQQQAQQPASPFAAQQGQPQQGQPETSPQFQQALDERALQILAENGYDVNAIVEQLEGGEGFEGQEGFDGQEGDFQGGEGQEGYPQQ